MSEGQKVLQQILGARARLDNDPGKYVQHAREEYQRTRQYFANAGSGTAAAAPEQTTTGSPSSSGT